MIHPADHEPPAPMNFPVWRIDNEVFLHRVCPGSASSAPVSHAPTIVDQFLQTFHVRVSTNMQNQCNGRSYRPMCTHMLCFCFFRHRDQERSHLQENQSPNIIELVRYTLLLPHGCGRVDMQCEELGQLHAVKTSVRVSHDLRASACSLCGLARCEALATSCTSLPSSANYGGNGHQAEYAACMSSIPSHPAARVSSTIVAARRPQTLVDKKSSTSKRRRLEDDTSDTSQQDNRALTERMLENSLLRWPMGGYVLMLKVMKCRCVNRCLYVWSWF